MSVDAQAVVVHHQSRDTVVNTVASLIAAGVEARQILVIDNSPIGDRPVELANPLVRIVRTSNRGFAAAANLGLGVLWAE